MLQGFLNDQELYAVDGERSLRIDDLNEPLLGPTTFELSCDGPNPWTLTIVGVSSDPTMPGRSSERRFRAAYWPSAGLFLVAGYKSAAIVEMDSGSLIDQLALEFSSAADILEIEVNERDEFAIVVSTKRFWVIRPDGSAERFETDHPVHSLRSANVNSVELLEYDVNDPALGLVAVSYPLGSGAASDGADRLLR